MALYCGIDLHSRDCWLAILDEGFEVVKEMKVSNDLDDVLRAVEPYRQELRGVAVESTFNWYWLVDGLHEAGHVTHLTNTSAIKQYEGLKHTDDRHDARWLAQLLALGILPEAYIYPKEERPTRDLLRRRLFLVRKRTAFLLAARGAFECQTGLRANSDDLKKWQAEDVDVYIDNPTAAFSISCLLEPIQVLSEQIKQIEKHALHQGKLRPEFAALETVWGIGKILALTIMYEVGGIERFRKVGNFTSYCRLVKTARLSAGKRKGSGNRRNGNPHLSWAFSEAAHFAVRHHEEAKRYFQRKRARTNGIVAIRALAHKLARAAFYVMRDGVDFDPGKTFA